MIDFQLYGEYLHKFMNIPVYTYSKDSLKYAYPKQSRSFHPPLQYLTRLIASPGTIAFVETSQNAYYGAVYAEQEQTRIILGPVHPHGFDELTMPALCREYAVPLEEKEECYLFFQCIPPMHSGQFANLLILLNYALNGQVFDPKDFPALTENGALLLTDIYTVQTDSIQELKENDQLYNNFSIETELLKYIEQGDLNKLESFSPRAHKTSHFGDIAADSLRKTKNTFIIADTLVSRAAIKGGLPAPVAYSMCDIYMKQMEQLKDRGAVLALMQAMQRDFCRRVAEAKQFQYQDDILSKVIDYVHENTNKDLKTEDIAHAVGLSRSYLSRKFKQELGFGLSDFIRRCKLEEGRSLLLYSTKSISEISSYLCFSNQGHFQTLFKKQFGMTPFEYRSQPNHR